MSTDLSTNLLSGLYLLFDHNALVISYFLGLIICGIISFLRPSRLAFFLTFTFAVLTFGYEYDKHIIEPFRNQTLATIAPTPGTHIRAAKLINLLITEFLPIVLFVIGWGSLLASIVFILLRKPSSLEKLK